MIAIGDTLISEDILEKQFVCNLNACKGMCCIEGESGAPLEEEEIQLLESVIEEVKPFMRKEGIEVIENGELFEIDQDGDYVTPLIDGAECAYVFFDENGITKCSIEKAYLEGKTDWKKPSSCHLYPVRLTQLKDFIAVNYHTWHLCDPACDLGKELGIEVFKFLEEPLRTKFGDNWYEELLVAADLLKKQNTKG